MRKKSFIYFCIMFGALLQGVSMSIFLFPHSIPSGGAAGIAILMNYWFELPLGLSLWLTNIVFLLFALKYFGYTWTLRTIIAVAITSTTVSMISARVAYFMPHIHILFDIIAGSTFFGVGVGLLIRSGASSGGMVIPALMIASIKKWSPGRVMLGINLFIFLLTALVIDYKIVLFAIICQFLSTQIIDFMYEVQFSKMNLPALGWRKK